LEKSEIPLPGSTIPRFQTRLTPLQETNRREVTMAMWHDRTILWSGQRWVRPTTL